MLWQKQIWHFSCSRVTTFDPGVGITSVYRQPDKRAWKSWTSVRSFIFRCFFSYTSNQKRA